ncbi:MAG: NAD-dependent succinate-semialdehyde dehydrogenase [Propionibacteriaceae bacterium]|nr:NAD-dependent succinate-semialdehyde dehydrogenase [Propionibacteriaceae bacterium]
MTDSDLVRRALACAPTDLFIGGAWRPAMNGATFPVTDPATGARIADVADADASDAVAALDAACDAQRGWAATSGRERSEVLRRAFDLVISHTEELSALITLEMGKPLADARSEVVYGAEFLRWFSEEAVRVGGRTAPAPEGTLRILTASRPVGPCLAITPWNFPLAMATRKIGPALAAGCTVVLKPASLTPLTAAALVDLLHQAQAPAGVVNLVTSSHAGHVCGPLLADRRLRKLTFTGSTPVGRSLLAQASHNVLRCSMELGGCAPFLVFDDADIDQAVRCAVTAKTRSNGEACNAANTFYVQRGVVEEFTDALTQAFARLTLGPGLDPGVDLGPLVSSSQRQEVASMVDQAVAQGAVRRTGGVVPESDGYFYPATVLADVPPDAAIATSEIFGPVAPVVSFDTEEEAVRLADRTDYGLAAYLHTADLSRVARIAERLEVGMLSVNTGPISNAAAPFGGMKHSGLGREGGSEGIGEYLECQYIGLPR